MSLQPLTGNRIRDRRLDRGLRQKDLAAQVGISPSYLNLIEHNARRIGGKLLVDLARALGVDPVHLTDGVEYALRNELREAAADAKSDAELAKVEEFLGRFPGWATLVSMQSQRIRQLVAQLSELSDPLTHNPGLAASLHQVITAVTAIRSTASILIEDPGLDRDWQSRFHRNIHDDSVKLANTSRSLVTFLESATGTTTVIPSPQDTVAAYLGQTDHHIAELETGVDISVILADAEERAPGAGTVLHRWLEQYRADAAMMPLGNFGAAARYADYDPDTLVHAFQVPMDAVLRRLASLPPGQGHPPMGLAVCDGAGAFLQVKRIDGFSPPRIGAGCPLWPLYQALTQPGQLTRATVAMPEDPGPQFLCHAIAIPRNRPGDDEMSSVIATMLVRPAAGAQAPRPVGSSCRTCPRPDCSSRREPSILT